MNLPNYFLADLPPEATLSPAMVTAACDTLKRNRDKYLAPRPTEDIVRVLCEVANDWLQPENIFRRLALDSAVERQSPNRLEPDASQPAASESVAPGPGFPAATVQRGLDDFFRRFTPGNFQALLAQDLGAANASCHALAKGRSGGSGANLPPGAPIFYTGPHLLAHIAAGNLPNPALMSLTLGLLTHSAQFMKCATSASLLPRLFAHSVYHVDPKLGACLELAEWRGGQTDLEDALFAEADCVTATGSDETLAALRSRVPSQARFLGHGQRVSFGYVTREVLHDEAIAGLVSRVADDVVAWNQNGCLSPHAIYVEERGAIESDQFAALLAAELMQRESTMPRGNIPVTESAAIASRRAMYETLAVHRGDVKLWQSQDSTAWTVVFEHETRFHFSPLNRFIFVKPVPDLAAVLQGVDDLKGKISTVAVAAHPETLQAVAARLAHWGVTRVCLPGQMQNPPLTWRHDGRPALGDLVTWTDVELEPSLDANQSR